MSTEKTMPWVVKLPIYFSLYHLFAICTIFFTRDPQLSMMLDFPVAPLAMLLLYLADKKVISVPNMLAIPTLFFR